MIQTNKVTIDIENKITTNTVLFFDMDGTLIDTNLANYLAYKKAIYSITKCNLDIKYNPHKRFNRTHLKKIIPYFSESVYEEIITKKEECYNEFLPEIKLIPNCTDILFKYSQINKTILVTNCRKDRAIATLTYFGLIDKFDSLFYREFGDNDKKINKFLNAISKLDISPNFVIAFENEENEIKDAQIAGIQIIIKST